MLLQDSCCRYRQLDPKHSSHSLQQFSVKFLKLLFLAGEVSLLKIIALIGVTKNRSSQHNDTICLVCGLARYDHYFDATAWEK